LGFDSYEKKDPLSGSAITSKLAMVRDSLLGPNSLASVNWGLTTNLGMRKSLGFTTQERKKKRRKKEKKDER